MDVMQLRKYQAVGNDFLLLLDLDEQQPIDEARARAVCDRRRGVGADGLIRLTPGRDGADITFELRNSDGSPAETSGNGLRCVMRALLDAGLVAGPRAVIETVVGRRVATAGDDGAIGVEMGSARIQDMSDGPSARSSLVDLGNPHLVILDEGEFELAALGAKYPQYNVELITVADGEIAMQVWERGAGETLARDPARRLRPHTRGGLSAITSWCTTPVATSRSPSAIPSCSAVRPRTSPPWTCLDAYRPPTARTHRAGRCRHPAPQSR
jgi:diaminopimelate epimerase